LKTKPRNLINVVFWLFFNIIMVSGADAANKIMPLGDSITEGSSSGVVDEALWVSYRKALFDRLKAAGYLADEEVFVGTLFSGESVANFDPDHEGLSGWTANQIVDGHIRFPLKGKLDEWLIAEEPNIILLHIGTNDVNGGNEDYNEIEDILAVIDDYEATSGRAVWVVLALIIDRSCSPYLPPCFKSSETTDFNEAVENFVYFPRFNFGDRIVLVDMQNDADIDFRRWTEGGDMWDDLHPFATGYAKMADLWFSALSEILPRADAGPDQMVFDEITLDGSLSHHPDGEQMSFQWQLVHRENSDFNRSATGMNPTVSNLKKGFYDVTLMVEDSEGRSAMDHMFFTATGLKGDFDFDGDVDRDDLSAFSGYYGLAQ